MQSDKYLGLAMAMRTNDKKSTDRLEKKTDDLKRQAIVVKMRV